MAEDPESGGEKSEGASSRKLSKAREEGQVAKSMEITSVLVLLGGGLALYGSASHIFENLMQVLYTTLHFDRVPQMVAVDAVRLLGYCMERVVLTCLPVFAVVVIMALIANIIQVGFSISWKAIELKPDRLNPINGFKQKFSSRALVELVKSILKVTIISLVVYWAIQGEIDHILRLYDMAVNQILLYILVESFWILINVCLIMLLVAILDYTYQKWKFMEDQKMTKKEVKDELKQTEGDPVVKSRIRQLQMEAARKRMMAAVPEADVVVTNPTRLAVALTYDSQKMDAPLVVAKGSGAVAANIRRIAQENDVPLVEDKKLAQNLYRHVDIGSPVPTEYYQAVAELLAYVYRLRNRPGG